MTPPETKDPRQLDWFLRVYPKYYPHTTELQEAIRDRENFRRSGGGHLLSWKCTPRRRRRSRHQNALSGEQMVALLLRLDRAISADAAVMARPGRPSLGFRRAKDEASHVVKNMQTH